MTTRTPLQSERLYLIDLLKSLSEAEWQYDTLCAGWTIEHLVAHLIVRERGGLLARLGILVPWLDPRHEAANRKIMNMSHADMIKRLERGPWWTTHVSFNILEHYIHNEDILRSQLNRTRTVDAQTQAALARLVPTLVKTQLLSWKHPLTIVMTQGDTSQDIVVHRGESGVVVRGLPGELLMLAEGRGRAAEVIVEGPSQLTKAFRNQFMKGA